VPQNIFMGGRDALRQMLAEREAREIQQREQSRQDQVVSQRDRQIGLQEDDLHFRRGRAQASDAAAAAEAEAEARQEAESQAQVQELIGVVTDPNQPQEARDRAGLLLDQRNVSPSLLEQFMTQPPEKTPTPSPFTLSPGQTRFGADGATIASVAPRPTGGTTFRDNPQLPSGTKGWIDSIAQRGVPVEQARQELSQGWQLQRQAHPNASLAEASKYLDLHYTTQDVPIDPENEFSDTRKETVPRFGGGGGDAAPAAPSGRAVGPGPAAGGGGSPAPSAEPAAAEPPAAEPPPLSPQEESALLQQGDGTYRASDGSVWIVRDGKVSPG
jgi:hypothetical protein